MKQASVTKGLKLSQSKKQLNGVLSHRLLTTERPFMFNFFPLCPLLRHLQNLLWHFRLVDNTTVSPSDWLLVSHTPICVFGLLQMQRNIDWNTGRSIIKHNRCNYYLSWFDWLYFLLRNTFFLLISNVYTQSYIFSNKLSICNWNISTFFYSSFLLAVTKIRRSCFGSD